MDHATKQTLVAQRLRKAVLDGELAPGTWLRQAELSTIAGVSRTPVREALVQLASEGLVTIHPHKGVRANPVSLEEFEDIYLVREALEPLAARLSAEMISADGLAELAIFLERLRAAMHDLDRFLAIESDMRRCNTSRAADPISAAWWNRSARGQVATCGCSCRWAATSSPSCK